MCLHVLVFWHIRLTPTCRFRVPVEPSADDVLWLATQVRAPPSIIEQVWEVEAQAFVVNVPLVHVKSVRPSVIRRTYHRKV
jgi:hypothetical protein